MKLGGIWINQGADGDVHVHEGEIEGVKNGVIIGVNPQKAGLKFSSPCVSIDYDKQEVVLQYGVGQNIESVRHVTLDKAEFAAALVKMLEGLVGAAELRVKSDAA